MTTDETSSGEAALGEGGAVPVGIAATPSPDPVVRAPLRRHRDRSRPSRPVVWLGRIVVPVVVLAIWQLCASTKIVDPTFTSKPTSIVSRTYDLLGTSELWKSLEVTIVETLIGFAIGSIGGIVFAMIMGRFATLAEIVEPYVTAINSLPRIALAPLFILWFGLGSTSKVVLSVSLVFFVLLASTLGGLATVPADMLRLARTLGFGEIAVQVRIVLRWALPAIVRGLELGLVTSFLGSVTGEMLGAERGMGVLLSEYANLFETDRVMAILLILAVVASVLAVIMRRLTKLLSWE